MTANDDIVRFSRIIVANTLANEKIDPVDFNLLTLSASPLLPKADRDVVDLIAYWQSKNGVISVRNVYDSCNNEPHLVDAVTNVFNAIPKDLTPEQASENVPEKAREKLLVALRRELAARFPAEVMTGAAGDFAHLYSSYMEVPKQFFYFSYLTCLGITLADSLTIDSELKPQPRLFTVILGESADDRKSSAISKTIHFFKDTATVFSVCWGVGSAEGLQKRMDENNRLLLAFDEFMAFVGKCRIEGSVLLPCVNSLFENNWYESQTKKSEVILNNAHLSILAASTVQTYERTWSPAFTDIGFNNRLWLVTGSGERKFSCPRTIPDESKLLAKKKLAAVLLHAEKHPVLEIDHDARERYDEWYMGRPRTIHGKRLDAYAMRLMPLLAVNDLKATVDLATVNKVIALCDHQHHVRQLHDPIDADSSVARLEEKVRRVLKAKGSAGRRDLKRALHVNQTGLWLFDTAINNLIREKELGFDKSTNAYFLQPEGVTTPVTGSG